MAETPDHQIHLAHKRRMQTRVVTALLVAAFIYFAFLFPQPVLDHLASQLSQRFGVWAKIASGTVGAATLTSILSFLLFAADSAFKGSNKTAEWVRSGFASHAAQEKYGCSEAEASALWFRFFDTWACAGSTNRILLENTYAATYTARAVFYLARAVVILIFLGVVSMALNWKVFGSYGPGEGWRRATVDGLALACFVGGYFFLTLTNKIPKGVRRATGCWARVEDVFGRSRAVFAQDILRHAATIPEAFDHIAGLRQSLLESSKAAGAEQVKS
jgi:hypothetical protein